MYSQEKKGKNLSEEKEKNKRIEVGGKITDVKRKRKNGGKRKEMVRKERKWREKV